MHSTLSRIDQRIKASEAADRQQAEYFRRVLRERCTDLDRRIEKYENAVARHLTRGNSTDARLLRRMMRTEQGERQTLERMLWRLHDRFVLPDEQLADLQRSARRS
ncbi:hypothetical protein [Mycobacterium sp.]|uniref:hypothetical protein n=1 Tax=Mycobacterium sp. TaxID=1785 RepID=UPI002D6F9577|nr:hypothetical protein [Mycobacterium sp.]HZA08437.1 hypothetical protein [Mycobacterium sp.]